MASATVVPAPHLAIPDDENYSLIIQLLLEDVVEMGASSKGKQREGSVSDADVARRLFEQELNNEAIFAADRRLTRSIQQAVQTDAAALARFDREERMARHDRDVSIALSKGLPVPRPPPSPPRDTPMTDIIDVRKFIGPGTQSKNGQQDEDDDLVFLGYGHRDRRGESSSWADSRPPAKAQKKRPCTSCLDDTPASQLILAPCQHEYCHQCLISLFRAATTDETLFPPKCCQQAMPMGQQVEQILGRGLVATLQEKKIEFETVNRIYCSGPGCGVFIWPGLCEDDVANCVRCGTRTCVHCKRTAHSGDCPFDHERQRVLNVARQEGWQRCFRCNAMVELNTGCFHITCRCSAEFCYLCGVEWKKCPCPQWEERRLYDRAAQINQRQQQNQGRNNNNNNQQVPQPARRPAVPMGVRPLYPGGPNPFLVQQPAPIVIDDSDDEDDYDLDQQEDGTQDRIGRIMDNLRENHECRHLGQWQLISGRHECEVCDHVLPFYIWECAQCNILACQRCRHNRL